MPASQAAASVASATSSESTVNRSPSGAQPKPIAVTSMSVRPSRLRSVGSIRLPPIVEGIAPGAHGIAPARHPEIAAR